MISKVVITAAGIGARLLTMTKEQPKEMMPLFALTDDGGVCVKPLLQLIFEQLHDNEFREFCFIIGRGKRVIEDHFTLDLEFIKQFKNRGKHSLVSPLDDFYKKIGNSLIMWINQPEPKGFGHAVLCAKPYIKNESFLVHAGDTFVFSFHADKPIERLIKSHEKNKSDATLLLKEIQNPKHYGVADVNEINSLIDIKSVIEKPLKPKTNLAIMPIYVFNPSIFDALQKTKIGLGGELQLTDAIQRLINDGYKIRAVKMRKDELRLDVGTPETYWHAIKSSYVQLQKTDDF